MTDSFGPKSAKESILNCMYQEIHDFFCKNNGTEAWTARDSIT